MVSRYFNQCVAPCLSTFLLCCFSFLPSLWTRGAVERLLPCADPSCIFPDAVKRCLFPLDPRGFCSRSWSSWCPLQRCGSLIYPVSCHLILDRNTVIIKVFTSTLCSWGTYIWWGIISHLCTGHILFNAFFMSVYMSNLPHNVCLLNYLSWNQRSLVCSYVNSYSSFVLSHQWPVHSCIAVVSLYFVSRLFIKQMLVMWQTNTTFPVVISSLSFSGSLHELSVTW